ncbi:hypothetical protein B0F90DRAFT_1561900, partial [Multifurca ochricompacta]
HEVRITQGGKIHGWVEFALKFFEENEEKALVLHTLPAKGKGNFNMNEKKEIGAAADNEEPQARQSPRREIDEVKKEERRREKLSPSTATIPRLISVVEIIKREYLGAMNAKRTPDLLGLYQYNEIGSLEDCVEEKEKEKEKEKEVSEADRMEMIAKALAGTENVMMKRSAYMKITLCRKELSNMKSREVTAQAPLKRKLSKSAKVRLKKRSR